MTERDKHDRDERLYLDDIHVGQQFTSGAHAVDEAQIKEFASQFDGKVYELTGPRSQDMHALAAEYSDALGRTITYVDVPLEQWQDQELRSRNLPDHVFEHLLTMTRLHAANRYDRLTHDVEAITGRPMTSTRDFVAHHAELFGPNSVPTKVSGAI